MAQEQGILIQVSDDGITGWSDLITLSPDAVTYKHTGLGDDVNKFYRLKAIGDGINNSDSSWSTVINATTFAAYIAEAETTAYLDVLGVVNDNTLYWDDKLNVKTGAQIWSAWNDFFIEGKNTSSWLAKMRFLYPYLGVNVDKAKVDALDPTNAGKYAVFYNGWKYSQIGLIPTTEKSFIELPFKYSAITGIAVNDFTVGFYNLSKESRNEDTAGNIKHQNTNRGTAPASISLSLKKDTAFSWLYDIQSTYTNPTGQTRGLFLSTVQSDKMVRTYFKGSKLGETAYTSGGLPNSKNITLRRYANGAAYVDERNSQDIVMMDFAASGFTDAEAISFSNAMENLINNLGLKREDIPSPVFYSEDVTNDSVYYPNVMKSVDWPEIATTKAYFVIYSTDHTNSSGGGIYWGEMDAPDFTGFIQRGLIIAGGAQQETPWLIRVPTADNGLSTDTIFIYYSLLGSPQYTKLSTAFGDGTLGLHLMTWTDRVSTAQGGVIPPLAGDTHLGYARVYPKLLGSYKYVMHHYVGSGGIRGYSYSNDAINWIRQETVSNTLNLPAGLNEDQDQRFPFSRNGIDYAIIRIQDENFTPSVTYLSLVTVSDDKRTVSYIKRITSDIDLRPIHGYKEGNTVYLYTKGGLNDTRFNAIMMLTFDLTQLD